MAELRIKEDQIRGGDAMFRIVYSTHLSLSKMADRKAHLMLSLNAFVLSFVVSKKKLGVLAHQHGLFIPDAMLVILCVTCIVLATLATRPAFPSLKPLPTGRKPNWLFFGDFSRYTPKEFHLRIGQLMADPDLMTEAMSRDLYWLGVSLGRKYRYLSLCYQVFFIGLILLVCVFAWFALAKA